MNNFCCHGKHFLLIICKKIIFYFSFLSHSSIKFFFSFNLIIFFIVNTLIKQDNKQKDNTRTSTLMALESNEDMIGVEGTLVE